MCKIGKEMEGQYNQQGAEDTSVTLHMMPTGAAAALVTAIVVLPIVK